MRRIPTPGSLLGSALVGPFALAGSLALALGLACAGKQTAYSSPCLDRCTNLQSSLDRSSCELDCQRIADNKHKANTPDPAATPPPEPSPATAPQALAQPTTPVVAQPTPTTPRPVTQPRPTTTTTTTTPVAISPNYAELQQQRNNCEIGCDAEPIPSDRSTCRLQCAQITNQSTSTPPGSTASSGTPTYVRPPTTTSPTTGTTRPVAVDPQVLAACLGTCNNASTPETDRATCRLQCNANGSVGPAPSSYYVLGGSPPSDADQRAAAIRSSQGVAGTATPTPPSVPSTPANQQKIAACAATAQQCNTSCSAQLSPCSAECERGKMSSTDRATCKLTCESMTDGCRDDCRIKDGRCRTKP